jgi:hypothetical protein
MGLGSWLRGLFATASPEEEAAEREEYGFPEPGESDLERQEYRAGFLSKEGTEAAENELREFERPDDEQ